MQWPPEARGNGSRSRRSRRRSEAGAAEGRDSPSELTAKPAKADAEPRTTESAARPGGPVERFVVAVGAKFFWEKGVLGMSESESRGPEVAGCEREKWGKKAQK